MAATCRTKLSCKFLSFIKYSIYIPPSTHTPQLTAFFGPFIAFLTPLLSDSLALVSGDFNKFSTRPFSLLGLENIVQFPTRDQAYLDHVYVNHPSLFATRRRAPLSTSDHAIIRILPKIYSQEHHQVFIKTSRRVVRQRILAPSNIENYQTMLEATNFSIFKSESIQDYADSLAEYYQFCFDTCCPLEAVYVSATNVSSPHLNHLRRKKERYFKNGQKHHLTRCLQSLFKIAKGEKV